LIITFFVGLSFIIDVGGQFVTHRPSQYDLGADINRINDSIVVSIWSICGDSHLACHTLGVLHEESLENVEFTTVEDMSSVSIFPVDTRKDTLIIMGRKSISDPLIKVLRQYRRINGQWEYLNERIDTVHNTTFESGVIYLESGNVLILNETKIDNWSWKDEISLLSSDLTRKIWSHGVAAPNELAHFNVWAITESHDDNILLMGTGRRPGVSGLYKTVLQKYSRATGEVVWSTSYDSLSINPLQSYGVASSQEGDIAIASNIGYYFDMRAVIYHLDAQGRQQWKYIFNRDPRPTVDATKIIRRIKVSSSGDLIICGHNNYWQDSIETISGSAGWLARISEEGELLWEHTYSSLFEVDGVVDGHVLFYDFLELDGGDLVIIGTIGIDDNSVTGESMGLAALIVRVNSEGCIVDHHSCRDQMILTSSHNLNHFRLEEGTISIYPNPASGILSFKWDLSCPECTLELVHLNGKIMNCVKGLNPGINQVNIEGLPSGVYFMRVKNHNNPLYDAKIIIAQ